MKTSLNLAVALTVSLCGLGTGSAQTVVEYGKYNGGPLQMVVEEGSRILVRIPLGMATETIESSERARATQFLAEEADRLTSSGKPLQLGESGYRFIWEGGYPYSGSEQQISNGILYQSLWFGEKAQVLGREIRGKGRELKDGPPGVGTEPQIIIKYGRFNGGDLQMVVDKRGRVVIRLDIGEATKKDPAPGDAHNFLVEEVKRLTSDPPDTPIALGESGYRFVYAGGYPIWETHEQNSDGTIWHCLWFAEKAEITRREIRARGDAGTAVRTYPRPGGICGDVERIANSVSPELLQRLHSAIVRGDFKKVNEVVDTPGSGLSVHGNSGWFWVTNGDGCTVARRPFITQSRP